MYRKSFLMLALAAVAGSTAQAQVPVPVTPQPVIAQPYGAAVPGAGLYRYDVVTGATATPLGTVPGIPQGAPQLAPGVAPIGQPIGPNFQPGFANPSGGVTLPPTAVTGPGNTLTQGIPIPPGSGPITSVIPQPTVAVTNGPAGPQTQIYTPTYYYYYYQPQAQQQPAYAQSAAYVPPAAYAPQVGYAPPAGYGAVPLPQMYGYGAAGYGANDYGVQPAGGQMYNARGEMGHVRYPYHSYRRPWYFPGQPNFNVTIDGPVW